MNDQEVTKVFIAPDEAKIHPDEDIFDAAHRTGVGVHKFRISREEKFEQIQKLMLDSIKDEP